MPYDDHHDHHLADIDYQHDVEHDIGSDDDVNDSGAYDGSDEYVYVRRSDYDNLAAAIEHYDRGANVYHVLNAARTLVNHVNDCADDNLADNIHHTLEHYADADACADYLRSRGYHIDVPPDYYNRTR